MAGGAAITGALSDVMPTQWRVEWTALAGCGWRCPSLVAMSDRRPRAHVQVNYILTPQYWEPMRPRYLVWVRGQWGSSLGRSVKVMGASYDLLETKTGSGAQCGSPFLNKETTLLLSTVGRCEASGIIARRLGCEGVRACDSPVASSRFC